MSYVYKCECGARANKSGNGLNGWTCSAGCGPRRITVDRFIGCGKESERKRFAPFQLTRRIRVHRVREVPCQK